MKRKILFGLVIAMLMLSIPAAAYAHCEWNNISDDSVITWFTADAAWYSSYVDTTEYQRWGAPYCYVKDSSLLYYKSGSSWVLDEYTYWYDYDSDTGFDHVWEPHDQHYGLSSGYSYKAVLRGERIANHASVIPHRKDVDTIEDVQ